MHDRRTATVGSGWLAGMLVGLAAGAVGAGLQWSPWVGVFVLGLGFSGLLVAVVAVLLFAAALLGRE